MVNTLQQWLLIHQMYALLVPFTFFVAAHDGGYCIINNGYVHIHNFHYLFAFQHDSLKTVYTREMKVLSKIESPELHSESSELQNYNTYIINPGRTWIIFCMVHLWAQANNLWSIDNSNIQQIRILNLSAAFVRDSSNFHFTDRKEEPRTSNGSITTRVRAFLLLTLQSSAFENIIHSHSNTRKRRSKI